MNIRINKYLKLLTLSVTPKHILASREVEASASQSLEKFKVRLRGKDGCWNWSCNCHRKIAPIFGRRNVGRSLPDENNYWWSIRRIRPISAAKLQWPLSSDHRPCNCAPNSTLQVASTLTNSCLQSQSWPDRSRVIMRIWIALSIYLWEEAKRYLLVKGSVVAVDCAGNIVCKENWQMMSSHDWSETQDLIGDRTWFDGNVLFLEHLHEKRVSC